MALNKKQVTLLGLIGIGLSTVIGAGIWKDPLKWANSSSIFSLIAVLIAWIAIFAVGLAYAECVSMFPQSGGPYSFVGGAFNKTLGSYTGLLFITGYSFVGVVLAVLSALFTLITFGGPVNALNLTLLTLAFVIILAFAANISNPRILGWVSFGWVSIKILLIVVVGIIAFTHWDSTNISVPDGTGFQNAINFSVWGLLGFETMIIFAGDAEDTEEKTPKGVLIALGVIIVLYLFYSLAASGLISIGSQTDTGSVTLLMVLAAKANIPSEAITFFAAFSSLGTGYAIFATVSYNSKFLSEQGVLPKFLSKSVKGESSKEEGTSIAQTFSFNNFLAITVIMGALSLIPTLTIETWAYGIDVMANTGLGFVLVSTMLPAGITLLYLRIKAPALKRPFKTPLYPVVFFISTVLSLYLLYLNFSDITNLWPALVIFGSLLLVILGIVLLVKQFEPAEEEEAPVIEV